MVHDQRATIAKVRVIINGYSEKVHFDTNFVKKNDDSERLSVLVYHILYAHSGQEGFRFAQSHA